MKDQEIEQLLALEGWSVECWSPLEIRHEDGSVATMQAAKVLIASLTDEIRLRAMHSALTDIGATARLAQAATKSTFEAGLWAQVAMRTSVMLDS